MEWKKNARYADRKTRKTANALTSVKAAGRNGEKIKPSGKEFKDTDVQAKSDTEQEKGKPENDKIQQFQESFRHPYPGTG